VIRSVDALLEGSRLLVLVGSGGVGKTTVSAALALRAAKLGQRVLVITIDPARRLATSLGIEETGNRIVEVEGLDLAGRLYALMLDARSTFDELIWRISPDPATRDRVLGNRLYRLISESIAGSQNFMATEKLHEVASSGEFDLVVLDTPPTSDALDFLESSRNLASFLDERVMSLLLQRRKGVVSRLTGQASRMALRLIGLLFGRAFTDELLDFFDAFSGLYRGFRERAQEVRTMLRAPDTGFAVVCTPRVLSLKETARLAEQLESSHHPVRAWFVNQCGPHPGRQPRAQDRWLSEPERRELLDLLLASSAPEDARSTLAEMERAYGLSVARSDDEVQLLDLLGPDATKTLVWTLARQPDEVVELPSLLRFSDRFAD
jgi:anion-transporting  ArsA/GET3 family ATPase